MLLSGEPFLRPITAKIKQILIKTKFVHKLKLFRNNTLTIIYVKLKFNLKFT